MGDSPYFGAGFGVKHPSMDEFPHPGTVTRIDYNSRLASCRIILGASCFHESPAIRSRMNRTTGPT